MSFAEKSVIKSPRAPEAIGPYSPAIGIGELVFCSGQIGIDPATGQIVDGGVAAETHQVLKNLRALLEESGGSLDSIVKTTVFLVDMADFASMNTVYAEYFTGSFPARSTIAVAGLPKNAMVEIEAIARIG